LTPARPDLHEYVAIGHFFGDHKQCVVTAGSPPGAERVYVNLDIYRACLRSKGWKRVGERRAGQHRRRAAADPGADQAGERLAG
jgi:hypothetical protein